MLKILLDQGIPYSTKAELVGNSWEVVHVCDLGLSRASDAEILEFAQSNSMTIVTLDADFHALIAISGYSEPSVIRIRREGMKGKEIAAMMTRILPTIDVYIRSGAVVTITDKNVRLRKLPLQS